MHLRLAVARAFALATVPFAADGSSSAASREGPRDRTAILVRALLFFPKPPARAFIERIAERLPFAVARFTGIIEGRSYSGVLVFRRFDFGWQVLDYSIARLRPCDIGISMLRAAEVRALISPSADLPSATTPCSDKRVTTRGPIDTDDTSIREVMQNDQSYYNETIPAVHIANGFALATWAANGGGFAVFAKRSGVWRQSARFGGSIDVHGLAHYGVPLPAARRLVSESVY